MSTISNIPKIGEILMAEVKHPHDTLLDLIIKVTAKVSGKVLTLPEAYRVLTTMIDYETFVELSQSNGNLQTLEMTLMHVIGDMGRPTADVLKDDRRHLAKLIRDLITEKETTVVKLAQDASVAVGTVSKVLDGASVDFGIYQRILDALGRKLVLANTNEFVHRVVNQNNLYIDEPPALWEMVVEPVTEYAFRRMVTSDKNLTLDAKYKATVAMLEGFTRKGDVIHIGGRVVKGVLEEDTFKLLVTVKPTPEQFERIKHIGMIHSGQNVLTVTTGDKVFKVSAGALIKSTGANLAIPLVVTDGAVENVTLYIDWDGIDGTPGQRLTLDLGELKPFNTIQEAMDYVPEPPADPLEVLLAKLPREILVSDDTLEEVTTEIKKYITEEEQLLMNEVINLGNGKFEVIVERNGVKKSVIVNAFSLTKLTEAAQVKLNTAKDAVPTNVLIETEDVQTEVTELVATAIGAVVEDVTVKEVVVEESTVNVTLEVEIVKIGNEEARTGTITVVLNFFEASAMDNELAAAEALIQPIELDEAITVEAVTAAVKLQLGESASLLQEVTEAEGVYTAKLVAEIKEVEASKSKDVVLEVTTTHVEEDTQAFVDKVAALIPAELLIEGDVTVESVKAALVALVTEVAEEQDLEVIDQLDGTFKVVITDSTTEVPTTKEVIVTVKVDGEE